VVRGERADGVESRELRARAGGQAGSESSKGGRVGQNKERGGLLAERMRAAQKYRSASDNKLGDASIVHGCNLLKSIACLLVCYLRHVVGPPLLSNV
jgi:hypothetical protein